jgi:hypothetical protein
LGYENKIWIANSKPMIISLLTAPSNDDALPTIECLNSATCSVLSRFIIKSMGTIDYVTKINKNLLSYLN